MKKILLISVLTLTLSACTLTGQPSVPQTPTHPTNLGQPKDAKMMSGYEYPAIPLDQLPKATGATTATGK